MQKAQGAIEYLLLMAAAVAVVAVVISYMIAILGPTGDTIDRKTLDALCGPTENGGFDQNSLLCGCYQKSNLKGETDKTGTIIMASRENCPEKLPVKYQNNQLLIWE